MAQPPEPIDPNFRIELPEFDGPLDLLLHLIQKHELDILDLPVAFVTERYLEYLGMMKELNLDVAAEYLVMAATLAHIKSKMLLPTPPADDEAEDIDEIDPREELIRRLLEYQKYKLAGENLGARGVAGRDVFTRGIPAPQAEGPAPLASTGLFKLLDAFQFVLARVAEDAAMEVTAERISIQERMTQLSEKLRERRSAEFRELFEGLVTRYDMVVTFLAILEMAKLRMIQVYQADTAAPIELQYRLLDPEMPASDVAPRAEEDLDLNDEEVHTSSPVEPPEGAG
ncbi:MAG: segregation/condensation protein A [Myxococcota bacterium]